MTRRAWGAVACLVAWVALAACGPERPTPDTQATGVAVRSRATLKARALPTSTWTPGPSPTPGLAVPSETAPSALPEEGREAEGPTAPVDTAAGTPGAVPTPTPSPAGGPGSPPAPSPAATSAPAASPTPAQPTVAPSEEPTATPTSGATPSPTPGATRTPTPTASPTPTHSPMPHLPRLAFATMRDEPDPENCGSDCNLEIYLMNDDGSGLKRLTNHASEDGRPSWSPDGSRIAFDSFRNGVDYDLYVMNDDGSNVMPLTDNPSQDVFPAWSPDGSRIAFVSLRDEPDPAGCYPKCNWELYVMNADGSGVTRLTNDPAEDFGPTWSPDGTRIAFDSNRDDSYNIYVMNADGSGVRQLTNSPAGNVNPAWSPDGRRIAFTSVRADPNPETCDPCNWEIYVMNADGQGASRLTNHPAVDEYPTWSPDSARLTFVSWRDGNAEIYVMNSDGSGLRRLTNHPANDWDAVWAPQ